MTTRNKTIKQYVDAYTHETNVSEATFADMVVSLYACNIKEVDRTIKFHMNGDAYNDMRANAQILRRFFNGETRLPCEIEESIVLALPVPWRESLLQDLSARYGLLPTPIPSESDCDIENAGDLFKEFGEALQALSPLLVDGRIDKTDLPHADKFLKEANDVMGLLTSLTIKVGDLKRESNIKVVQFKKT